MPSMDELVAIKERVETELLGRPGVTGVDVGYKEVAGERTDDIAVRVHVRHKTDVPEDQRIPSEIDGARTDVVERHYEPQVLAVATAAEVQTDVTKYPVLRGGISMGPSRAIGGYVYVGTLGAVVVDRVTGKRAVLTNFHVACVDTTWSVGDRMVQPSRVDGGAPVSDAFGALTRAVLSQNVDGAVVSIDAGRLSRAEIVEIGNVDGTRAAVLGMAVRKRGRTTGLTYGTVDGLALTVNLDYGNGIGQRTLYNQMSIVTDAEKNATFSQKGDSGSVVVDDSGTVIGLLFGGTGAYTVANPVAAVLAELDIKMAKNSVVVKRVPDVKYIVKDLIKDKELKEFKDVPEIPLDTKWLRDIVKPAPEGPPFPDLVPPRDVRPPTDHPSPDASGQALGQAASARLAALEAGLADLSSFIAAELRPDLSTSAFAGEEQEDADGGGTAELDDPAA